MADTIEDIPTMTATERLVQILEREESSAWQKADAVLDAVGPPWSDPDQDRLDHGSHASTGLFARIDEVWQEIKDAHIQTEDPSEAAVRLWFQVAKAWPEETRVEGATYSAHAELAWSHWQNRQGILSKIVAKTRKRNGPDAIATKGDVRLWKQTQEPAPNAKPWDEKFYRRLDSVIHSAVVGPKTKTEWGTAISLVKRLLDEMREEAENAK